jgi:hypothetical protein
MKKVSFYLDHVHVARLRRLADDEGRAQVDIVRDAILMYKSTAHPPRTFALSGVACGPGGSIADIPDEELMKGFGEK